MKRLSLQWRITLMTVLLIGVTCVVMNLLLCSSGVYYICLLYTSLRRQGYIHGEGCLRNLPYGLRRAFAACQNGHHHPAHAAR